jgi:hypothetical protein
MSTETKATAVEAKLATTAKTRKPRANKSRSATGAAKLVCRYCGSNDLAPSFKKRRDARCRACFKQRYGSAARGKKATRTRQTKVAK